jgi:hypothetical protein
MVLALKMADVVCARNFFRRKGTKPILQVTVYVGHNVILNGKGVFGTLQALSFKLEC